MEVRSGNRNVISAREKVISAFITNYKENSILSVITHKMFLPLPINGSAN